ncbi:MAG TPA: redox-sensing transcriptional repressor Rex [Spirochaetales bacterium]|nr:redox-sensing transcriptional repressor Rex [Spirochaetales bacterium]
MIEPLRISLPTLKRLPLYRRILEEKAAAGDEWVSSDALARRLGQCAVQVRKDLAQAGLVGKAKYGFPVAQSIAILDAALGSTSSKDVFVIGAGPMADAALADESLAAHGFKAIAVFEPDPALVGASVGRDGARALPLSKLPDLSRRMGVRIAILAVGGAWAQAAADGLKDSGIEAVLDLSPAHPQFPAGVRSVRADFGAAIAALAAGL